MSFKCSISLTDDNNELIKNSNLKRSTAINNAFNFVYAVNKHLDVNKTINEKDVKLLLEFCKMDKIK